MDRCGDVVRRSWLSVALVVAVGALAGSVAFAAGRSGVARVDGSAGMMAGSGRVAAGGGPFGGAGMTGGSPMMGGSGKGSMTMGAVWLAGDGNPVASILAARGRAAKAAAFAGLHPGEVIWFDNGFYVELKDSAGAAATEVLVDTVSGAVSTEPGPAMMWNTRYGAHRSTTGGAETPAVSAAQARRTAARWLSANLPGRTAEPPDAYPGYCTLETTTGGVVDGMLSVNATTGQVWYHTWHGRFIAREDS